MYRGSDMTREEVKIGFIGFGNMGQAIADGFLYTHTLKPSQMCACAVNYEKLKKNTEKHNPGKQDLRWQNPG